MGKNPLIGGGHAGRGRDPGDDGRPPLFDPNDLFGSCERLNSLKLARSNPSFYYVAPANENIPEKLAIVHGIDAQEIWTVYDGKRIGYKGWPRAKLDAIERKCRWFIQRATPSRA